MLKNETEWNKLLNSEICHGKGSVDVLLPWCLELHKAKLLCNKYRGKMTIITSSKLQEDLFSKLEEITDAVGCLSEHDIWTGFSDEQVEGHFVDLNEGIPMKDMMESVPFAMSQPNGEREENCVMAYDHYYSADQNDTQWYDTYCHSTRISFFCRIDSSPRVQIRGKITQV